MRKIILLILLIQISLAFNFFNATVNILKANNTTFNNYCHGMYDGINVSNANACVNIKNEHNYLIIIKETTKLYEVPRLICHELLHVSFFERGEKYINHHALKEFQAKDNYCSLKNIHSAGIPEFLTKSGKQYTYPVQKWSIPEIATEGGNISRVDLELQDTIYYLPTDILNPHVYVKCSNTICYFFKEL